MSLVDQFGVPIASTGRMIRASVQDVNSRPNWPVLAESIKKSVNQFEFRVILSLSRQIYSNFGVARGAINQKAGYATEQAWDPVFQGEATEWGADATAWLEEEWYKIGNIRGLDFGFRKSLELDSVAIDRDGDCGYILVKEGKYPMVQAVPAHLLWWMGGALPTEVPDGTYKGAWLSHGVICDRKWRPIAYRVYVEDNVTLGVAGMGATYQDVPAANFIHVYDPDWHDATRGFPAFAFCLLDFQDSKTSMDWELLAQMLLSKLAIVETNTAGGPDLSDPLVALNQTVSSGLSGVVTEKTVQGGMTKYFKAGAGEKLEQVTPTRPGDVWDSFQDRVVRAGLAGINWPYSFVWKGDEARGPSQRVDIDKARASVAKRQTVLTRSRRRMIAYAIAGAIDMKILKPYPGKDVGGQNKWGFSMPPLISIDDGKDAQAEREGYKIGHQNLTGILAKRGVRDVPKFLAQRAEEVAQRKLAAEAASKKFGVEVSDADMCLLTNVVPQPQEEDSATQPGGQNDSKDKQKKKAAK